MPVVVEGKEEADYEAWLAGKKEEAVLYQSTIGKQWTNEELMAKGEAVYSVSCAGCHQSEGQGIAGIFPSLIGSSIVTGPVEGHIGILINGVAGSAMQSFADQLSEVDLAAVIHYKRNSWGNDMDDIVQPLDILNYKQSQ
jgi:cytochrome c oxidase subunit 2